MPQQIGTVASAWRYPVKSMAGHSLAQASVGHSGLYGDRLYALVITGGREAFPWLTARECPAMLGHHPVFRHPDRASHPPNWNAAATMGVTPLFGSGDDLALDIRTPAGTTVPLDAPDALARLRPTLPGLPPVTLHRSDRPMTDCGPVSLIDHEFLASTAARLGRDVDPRLFRANFYLELHPGLRLEDFVGQRLLLGRAVELLVREREGRCVFLTLPPDGGPAAPDLLRDVAQNNAGTAGVLAVVLREGLVTPGDAVYTSK